MTATATETPRGEPKPAGKDGDGVAAGGTDQDKSDESDNPDAISESDLFGDGENEEDAGVVYRSAGNDDEGYMSVATDADAADEEAVGQGLSNFVWQESGPSEWDAAATNEVTEVAAPGRTCDCALVLCWGRPCPPRHQRDGGGEFSLC